MSSTSTQKTSILHSVLLIVVAMGVVVSAVFITLYYNSTILGVSAGDSADKAYKNVGLGDAQINCENHARKQLGRRLKVLAVDGHSSRFDEADNRYKIFMQAELYENDDRKGLTGDFFVYCFSRGDRAEIAQFKVIELKDDKPSAIRKEEGGIFGWK